MNNKYLQIIAISLLVCLAGLQQKANASLLQLTHDPLFLNQSVPPAMAVTFDDSGSMAWGFMGPFFGYDTRQFTDPSLNKVYYNPNIVYRPPIGADGVEFAQSNFNNAKVDGFDFRAAAPRVNLATNFIPIASYNFFSQGDYRIRFARTPNTPGVDTVNTFNYNDTYPNAATRNAVGRRAYYYNGNTLVPIPAAQEDNFANWYTYYSNRLKLGKTAVSRAFATFGTDFKITWQQLNNNTTFPALDRFQQDHRDDFFDWLYAVPSSGGTPLRNAFWRAGRLFENANSYDSVDFNTANLTCQQNFHIALSDGEWNGGFGQASIQDETNLTGGLPGDSDGIYGAYDGNDEQRIYPSTEGGTTLSDIAFHFWARDLMPSTAFTNNVKRFKGDYTDADGNDIVFAGDEWENGAFVWNPKNDPAYWQHLVTYNVGMGLEASRVVDYENTTTDGNAATNPICPEITTILDAKEAVFRGLRSGACQWPPATNAANKVDDVWHSSLNSRGDFFSANDPQELSDALNSVVNSILERLSRGSTSSVSSGVVTAGTKAYTPGFDSSNWTGNMFSRPVNRDGSFDDVEWDMACSLTGGMCEATGETVAKQSVRRIYTYNSQSETTVNFDDTLGGYPLTVFTENSEELRTRLGVTTGELIDYISGDQDEEIQNNGVLRNRENVLSDIVHSSPRIQRGPSSGFDDNYWPDPSPEKAAADNGSGFEQYQSNNLNRTNMLYVGSNGGMLHAINIDEGNPAALGKEQWGFIPSKALENVHRLPDPQYQHWSYVDNSGIIGDAFFNSSWKTVYISGMRYGGQAYFALDVTNPDNTAPDVLWEFTDKDDADMGFSYGKASIARIQSTGDWVAFIPNGYNSSQKDFPSLPDSDPKNNIGDGSAVLYVVRLRDGQLLAKLDTNVGTPAIPNGMAPAMPVVSRFYGDTTYPDRNEHGADFAYAGDLYGNVWRFDLTSSNYSDWEDSSSIHKVVAAQGVKAQPITTQVRVLDFPLNDKNNTRDNMVYFGTGKYIETSDRSINLLDDQYVVGLLDGLARTDTIQINDGNIIEQTLTTNGSIRNFDSPNDVDYSDPDVRGWKVELTELGERVANPIALFSDLFLLVTSTVTAGEDPCVPGGVSWLTAIDPYYGAGPQIGNLFDDEVTIDVNGTPVTQLLEGTSILINDLIIGSPPIVQDQFGNASIIVEGSEDTTIIELDSFTWRRRGWKNLLSE